MIFNTNPLYPINYPTTKYCSLGSGVATVSHSESHSGPARPVICPAVHDTPDPLVVAYDSRPTLKREERVLNSRTLSWEAASSTAVWRLPRSVRYALVYV
uniref:Uncharacterized protein n=1 Tax=Cacopsylla melanoneura TaxID=428564 RepID=A0A8D9BVM7_9HEMI